MREKTASLIPAIILSLLLSSISHADTIYLSKEEALKIVLGDGCAIEYQKRTLPADLLSKLDEAEVQPRESEVAHIFLCNKEGRVDGYAFIDSQVGKHMPITFVVGISPTGKVTRTEIMVYREHYGAQARKRSFMKQFEGRDSKSELRVGRDVIHVTGATLSSKAIAVGVKRDLMIWNYFFGKPNA